MTTYGDGAITTTVGHNVHRIIIIQWLTPESVGGTVQTSKPLPGGAVPCLVTRTLNGPALCSHQFISVLIPEASKTPDPSRQCSLGIGPGAPKEAHNKLKTQQTSPSKPKEKMETDYVTNGRRGPF